MNDRAPNPMDNQEADPSPGTPRWVKVLAVSAAIAVLVLIAVMLLVGGEHGPGMHGG